MDSFLELKNCQNIKICLDLLETKNYNHQDWHFKWITYEPSLSQHNQVARHLLSNHENQESVIWLIDGLIEINLGMDLINLQPTKYQLDISEGLVLTGLHHYRITVRSAWPAQILLINRTKETLKEPLLSRSQPIRLTDIFPIGKYGIWRSYSEVVRDILGIDRINLIVGQSGFSWLGAKYLTEADFRLILCQFPAGKVLSKCPELDFFPSFINQGQDDLIFIGLEGFIQIMIDGLSQQWLTCGKLLIIHPKQKVNFIDRGREAIKFLVLSPQKTGSLASNLLLEAKVLNVLAEIQGPIWSRLSWPIIKSSGIVFEESPTIVKPLEPVKSLDPIDPVKSLDPTKSFDLTNQ